MKRRIVASQIAVEWNDKPKLVVLNNDMPDWVREPFDEWLRDIENEENAITEKDDWNISAEWIEEDMKENPHKYEEEAWLMK